MRRLLAPLAVLLAATLPACDTSSTFVEPFEVVVYVDVLGDGLPEYEAARLEVPRNAVPPVPLTVPVPRTATGLRLSADLAQADSVGFVTVVRPERFDVYDLPRGLALTGATPQVDLARGVGGAFLPLLVFSTDSLWTDSRPSAQVVAQIGTQESGRTISRSEAVVPVALTLTAEDLGLGEIESDFAGSRAEVRFELRGARGQADLVAVLVSMNDPGADFPASTTAQVAVLYRDVGNGDHLVLPSGGGVRSFVGSQYDPEQTFSLVLLRP